VTTVRTKFVDVYVLRGSGTALEVLLLRRGTDGRCPGSWETVNGHIEPAEAPADAARRELAEETGLEPERLYNLSRVELFYQHRKDEIALVPVFAAFVAAGATPRLSPEHDRQEWLRPDDARTRFAWPRERRALEDILLLLGDADAGPLNDALLVC
jgi:8-oxo-dGTP pyrophosphatase MutT (NUDIX family)